MVERGKEIGMRIKFQQLSDLEIIFLVLFSLLVFHSSIFCIFPYSTIIELLKLLFSISGGIPLSGEKYACTCNRIWK